MIELSAETVQRVEHILAGVPKGAERALSNAMNKGLSKVKSGAIKKVREVYTVQSRAASEATKTRIKKASTGDLAGYISFAGYKIPLYKFSVTPKVPGTGKTVFASVKKGSGGVLEEAFVAQMKSGHLGVFERTGEQGIQSRMGKTKSGTGNQHTEKLEEKMGLAMGQMIGNQSVLIQLEQETQELINNHLEHEIDRILSGYGG